MRHVLTYGFGLFAAAVVSGCSIGSDGRGGVGASIGITASSPDEFLIIANKPLQLPPSFELPTPTPGVASRVELDPFSDAHLALFNRREPVRLANASEGETILLAGADADGDNETIRQVLADEDPNAGERKFGLRTFLGVPVPASLDNPDAQLEVLEENERLREQGFLTPTAPPIEEEPVSSF